MSDAPALRRDLAAFSRAISRPLEPWQARSLELDSPITCVLAPRQAGKPRSLANLALHRAFRAHNQRVLVVSASDDAAKRLLFDIRGVAAGSPLLAGSVVVEQAGLVRLSNGSEIRSVPASERQIRGWSVDLLLVDEAALVDDNLLLGAAFPTVAARSDGRIVLASSATVASGCFYDQCKLGEAGSEHVRTFRWALADCHWITPSMIEVMKGSMSEVRFNAEMLGLWADGAYSLFSRQILEAATADYAVATLAGLYGPARVLGGVDWGAHHDRSAVCAIARIPVAGDRPVFGVVCAHRWPSGHPLTSVIEDIVSSPAHWACLSLERNGLGEPCAQMTAKKLRERPDEEGGAPPRLWRLIEDGPAWNAGRAEKPSAWRQAHPAWRSTLNPIHVTSGSKAATYSALRLLIDGGQLVLPASATELLRELMLLRVDLSPSGDEKIEASTGHDDQADALALSLGPYRDRSQRWRTVLADLADPRRAPPPFPAAAGLPTVETGAGLRVPAGCVYQSVHGREVTGEAGLFGNERGPTRVGQFILNTYPQPTTMEAA